MLIVWLYPIQFHVEPTLMECPSDFCMFKQIHPCVLLAIPPIPAPFLDINLNLLSLFEVLFKSVDLDSLIIVLL